MRGATVELLLVIRSAGCLSKSETARLICESHDPCVPNESRDYECGATHTMGVRPGRYLEIGKPGELGVSPCGTFPRARESRQPSSRLWIADMYTVPPAGDVPRWAFKSRAAGSIQLATASSICAEEVNPNCFPGG